MRAYTEYGARLDRLLARLEWAMVEVIHSAETKPLSMLALQEAGPEGLLRQEIVSRLHQSGAASSLQAAGRMATRIRKQLRKASVHAGVISKIDILEKIPRYHNGKTAYPELEKQWRLGNSIKCVTK